MNRMCRLRRFEFPKYWEKIVENLESADQLLACIKELHGAYQPKEGEGIAFYLEVNQGDILHIGCSDEGWVVIYLPKNGTGSITVGNSHAEVEKAFLYPE